jgi:hypothetical protein
MDCPDDSTMAPGELAQWSDESLLKMREEIAEMIAILNEAARESYYNERFRDDHPRFSEWIESGMDPDSWQPRTRRAIPSPYHQRVDSTPSAPLLGRSDHSGRGARPLTRRSEGLNAQAPTSHR